jgi:hypothetical protein
MRHHVMARWEGRGQMGPSKHTLRSPGVAVSRSWGPRLQVWPCLAPGVWGRVWGRRGDSPEPPRVAVSRSWGPRLQVWPCLAPGV